MSDKKIPTLQQTMAGRKRSAFKAWLSQIEGKIAFKTGLAASISLILGVTLSEATDRPDMLTSGLWCVLASIVVIQAYLGGTYQAAWQRFFGVLIGSIMGALSIIYLGEGALSLAIGIFCTIIVCSLLWLKDSLRIASMSTAVIIVLAGLHPHVNPWLFSFYRFIDCCVGIFVAICVAYFVWPEKAVENLRQNSAKILSLLARYYRLAVSFDTSEEGHEQSLEALYIELISLLEKNLIFRHDASLELFNKENQRENWTLFANQLEDTFDSIIALNNIPKGTLAKIMDDSLAKQTAEVIDQTDLALQNLDKVITREQNSLSLGALNDALTGLSNELLRFRETRTTRKFNIEDVESFFVYFYSLRAIGENIQKMNDLTKLL